jgi:predicted phage terminase large subunit-like protein
MSTLRYDNLSRAVLRALADDRIRNDLLSFIIKVFETLLPGEHLYLNWHIQAMAYQLEQIRLGKTRRLVITLPPRHLKSIVMSVALPAFLLGHDPTLKIICVSYSSDLAAKHSSDFRAVVNSDWYKRIFPAMKISPAKNTEFETMTTKRGYRFATSVGATLTGRGGDIIILDDAMSPKQAASESMRTGVIRWYQTTLLSRRNSKADGVIIHVAQRLHTDDLVGHVLEQGGWNHLNIPAIADEYERIPLSSGKYHHRKPGDVLDAVREPQHILDEIKAEMGTSEFSSQYLQQPIPREGNIIKREWLRDYDFLPLHLATDRMVISWDTAMKVSGNSDYSVATVWLIQKDVYYLVEVKRGRYDFPELKRIAKELKAKYRNAAILIEDKGSGTSLIQELRKEHIPVIAVIPDGDKDSRLYSCQPEFESGAVLFPKEAPGISELIDELLGFPSARHDDQVDSLSQAIRWNKLRFRPVHAGAIVFSVRRPSWP